MSELITKENFVFLLKETFEHEKDFAFIPTGDSMKPMLNGTCDSVVLTKKHKDIKINDVVLFVRKRDNALVLHRVVDVLSDNTYNLSGDNQYYIDSNVSYDDILAVLKSYTHNGKDISIDSKQYKNYVAFILVKKKARKLLSKIFHKIKK